MRNKQQHLKRHSGFTLIELMVTIAIIGILAAIAVPAYSDYVMRGNIPEATTGLASMRVRLEQYYQDNRDYGSTNAGCGVANPNAGRNFDIRCVSADGTNQTYLLTATGRGSMNGFSYTINQSGTQGSTAWGVTSTTCWITKKGEVC